MKTENFPAIKVHELNVGKKYLNTGTKSSLIRLGHNQCAMNSVALQKWPVFIYVKGEQKKEKKSFSLLDSFLPSVTSEFTPISLACLWFAAFSPA